jgi:acetyl-CoA C-acetyltransferase
LSREFTMKKTVIVSAVRTAGGKFGGSLSGLSAPDMGAAVVAEAVRRAGIPGEVVNEVIFGCGWQAGIGPNIARLATVKGGLPIEVPAFTVNVRCGSSLRAANLGTSLITAGDADVILVGGAESASNVPYSLNDARWGHRMGDKPTYDLLHKDGFMCPLAGMLMGGTAEVLVEQYGISREEQDSFSVDSHRKAVQAMEKGWFEEEVLPLEVRVGKKMEMFSKEEIPRADISMEKMAKLPLVFKKDGTVTAGNSCALCDAASAMVLMSEEKAAELGVKPMAVVRSQAFAGVDPRVMGIGPAAAVPIALKKAGMTMADIDLIELNEAFASQYIAVEREMKWDRDKVNVHGGAIALGHPVGATGTKILTTLLYALKTHNKSVGLVSLCIGGGQGVAMIVERV